jgi:hypothetical protein
MSRLNIPVDHMNINYEIQSARSQLSSVTSAGATVEKPVSIRSNQYFRWNEFKKSTGRLYHAKSTWYRATGMGMFDGSLAIASNCLFREILLLTRKHSPWATAREKKKTSKKNATYTGSWFPETDENGEIRSTQKKTVEKIRTFRDEQVLNFSLSHSRIK